MSTMILSLEFAALSSVLSRKFVLFKNRLHAHTVCTEPNSTCLPPRLWNFYAALVHVRGPDGATILVIVTPIMATSLW